jgi:OmpW family
MNRLRASLLHGSVLALAAACGLPCAAQAQVASPPPGKALVVMYRADKRPVAARVPVIANADRLGDIGNGEYVRAVVNPGRTFLRVGDKILTTLAIQTSANRTAYVLIEAVPGLSPVRVEMREMDEASARRVLAQSRPAGAGAAAVPRAAAAAPAPRSVVAPAVPLAAARAAPPPKPAAPPPPQPAPRRSMTPKEPPPPVDEEEEQAAELRKWRVAVIAKTGAFKLSTASQSIGGLMTSYDKSSKPVAAFEVEFRHQEGFAIGAEALYYKNSLTAPGTGTTFAGDQAVISGTVNGKYYFGGDSGTFHPFVGAGVGFAGAAFSGDFQGKSSGPSLQGMAGADLRFGDFGVYLEYKYVSTTTQDSANQKIKVGGSGVLAGVSFAF